MIQHRKKLNQVQHLGSKVKGFTLIEVLLCLSLITLTFNFHMVAIHSYRVHMNRIHLDEFNNSLMNNLMYSKQYCRKNKVSGSMVFDMKNNEYYFNADTAVKKIWKYRCKHGVKLASVNSPNGEIKIAPDGFTSSACTIKYVDDLGEEHFSTICVGTAYVTMEK